MVPKIKNKKSHKRAKHSMRLIRGGGECTAPDVVSQYISPLCHTMTKDIVGTSNIFQRVFEGPGPAETTQNGGGWTIDLANTIDKFPTYQRYDDEAPPVILNGKTYLSNSCQSQCGAGKISLYKVKKMSVKKLNHKSKPKTKSNKMTKTKRHHNLKMRKSKSKSKSKSRSKSSKHQKGGESAPASLTTNFPSDSLNIGGNVGQLSDFSTDMMTKDFNGKQPIWSPKTI